jgi:hypothetical protein
MGFEMSVEGRARSRRLLEVWLEATREESDGEYGFLSRQIGRLGRRLRPRRGRRKRARPKPGPSELLTLESRRRVGLGNAAAIIGLSPIPPDVDLSQAQTELDDVIGVLFVAFLCFLVQLGEALLELLLALLAVLVVLRNALVHALGIRFRVGGRSGERNGEGHGTCEAEKFQDSCRTHR